MLFYLVKIYTLQRKDISNKVGLEANVCVRVTST
jgi:hypothetical protein